jgi:predicted MFS family arabinose efflux permease
MVVPFMSIYCTQKLHFTIAQTGLIIGMFGAGSVVGALLSGRLVDKIGFYYIQVTTLFAGGIMFFVVAQLETIMSLCIGVFVLSLCNDSFRPANSTAIAHYSKEENRTRSYSLNRLAVNLGFSVGGALGGFLASHNYHLLFWVDGATNICAAFLLLKLLPVVKHTRREKHALAQTASPYKDKRFIFFMVMTVLFAICFMQLFSMQPLFLKTIWHINEQQIGILMAMNGLMIVAIEMVLVHSLEGKRNHLYFIRLGVFIVGLGFICMNILQPIFISAIISMLLFTIGEMLAMPFMNSYWTSRSQAHNRGGYASLYAASWSIAQVAAPALGSQIAEHAGFHALWWGVGVVCLLVMLASFSLEKKGE